MQLLRLGDLRGDRMEVISHLWQHYSIEILAALIIATVVLLGRFAAALLTSIFSPIKISGEWETKLDRGSGLTKHEDVKIHQCIQRVWGRATSTDGRSFRISGWRQSLFGLPSQEPYDRLRRKSPQDHGTRKGNEGLRSWNRSRQRSTADLQIRMD